MITLIFNHLFVLSLLFQFILILQTRIIKKKIIAEPRQTDNSPDKKIVKSEVSVYLSLALLSGQFGWPGDVKRILARLTFTQIDQTLPSIVQQLKLLPIYSKTFQNPQRQIGEKFGQGMEVNIKVKEFMYVFPLKVSYSREHIRMRGSSQRSIRKE